MFFSQRKFTKLMFCEFSLRHPGEKPTISRREKIGLHLGPQFFAKTGPFSSSFLTNCYSIVVDGD